MFKNFASSFRGYQKKQIPKDFLAALTVTAIAVPESLGFALIAGLPLETGLYCALIAPIVFAIFASSKRVIVGADSATASLVAAGGSAVAVAGTAAYGSVIVTLGLLTALVLILMSIFKFGFLVNFISKPVLVGFIGGVGIQLMFGKLPELVGIEAEGSLLEKLSHLAINLHHIDPLSILVSVTVIFVSILVGKTRFPGVLAGLIAAIALTIGLKLGDEGLNLVGALPSGLPTPVMPDLTPEHIIWLIPTAVTIALVVIAQGTSVIRDMAAKHDEKVRIDQDIAAYGFANAASALSGGFAINGSPPRSIASEMSGGSSQMVNIFMSIFVGLILVFVSGIFDHIPMAALAAIVFIIGMHLIRIDDFKAIYRTRRKEFAIAIIALIAVAILGVSQGLIIAIVISLLERLHRQYRTSDQIMLRDGVLSDWAKERINFDYRETRDSDGLLVYRFNGSIFFDNARYFAHRVKLAVSEAKKPVSFVLIDAGAIDDIDYTAVENLRRLYDKLKTDNIQLGFAHVAPHLRRQLVKYGVVDIIGSRNIYPTLNSAITTFYKHPRDVVSMINKLDLPRKQFVVIGGGVMAALGLRETHGVDIVVTDELYTKLRDELGWSEYAQDNGKCILNHEGFHAMRRWLGWGVRELHEDSLILSNVQYMNPKKLLEGKKRLGRTKDYDDIKLLQAWIKNNPNH